MNNNKNSKTNKVNPQQDGLNFVTNAKHKIRSSIVRSSTIRFSIHQGAQVLVSLFSLLSLGLLTSHRKIKQSKQNRNILAPLAHVRFSPDSQQGLRHGLSCTRLCENLFRIGFAKRLRISLFCLVCSIFLGYGFFFSNSAYAASYVDVSSNGDGTSGSGIVRLGRISPSSTGTQATGSDTLTIHTDCAAGYKVYVSSQENQSTSLVNSNAATPENPSAKDLITAASNVLGENVSSAPLSSNTWGINGNSNEAGNGLYYGLPSFENSTVFPLITMSNVAEESTVPIYYGVKVDTSINPGTYSGSVLYTVLINNSCLDYTVVFNPNVDSSSSSEITGTMSDQSIMYGETTALSPNAYTRTNYNFLGWSTSSTGKTGTVVNGIGTTADVDYADEADVLNLVSGGGIVTLYAIWEPLPTMQNWEGCADLSTNEYTTLMDSRDGEEYVVKKLADGKCWMVQNLRLINKTITPEDSNVSSDFTVPTSTPAGSSWCTSNNSTCNDQPLAYYDASTRSSYGALYNWYTATAGTGKYETTSGNVSSSICPKGWRLPTSGADGEFAALDIAWGGTGSNRSNANTYSTFTGAYTEGNNGGFDLAGFIEGSSLYVGTQGIWWSSTAYNNSSAYFLNLYSGFTSVGPQNYSYNKYRGDSVRCITEPPTMQNFDASTSLLNIGDMATLTDARDGEKYVVKRLPDGKVWMAQNLRLINKTITSADSNVSANFTVPTSTDPTQTAWCYSNSSACDDRPLAYYDASARSSYGALYNWYTATAGTGTYGTSSITVSSSICPKGWRLPTGDSNGEFAALDIAWGGTGSNRNNANTYSTFTGAYTEGNNGGFDLAGDIYGSSLFDVGTTGLWWSSTADYNNKYAFRLSLTSDNTNVNPQAYTYKYLGFSVRCVASS